MNQADWMIRRTRTEIRDVHAFSGWIRAGWVVAFTGLSLCFGAELEFLWQSDQYLTPFAERTVARFEKLNPDIDINIRTYANEAYKTAIQVILTSDAPPDLFFNWAGEDTGRFVRAGLVEDLTPFADSLEGNPRRVAGDEDVRFCWRTAAPKEGSHGSPYNEPEHGQGFEQCDRRRTEPAWGGGDGRGGPLRLLAGA